MLLLKLPLLLKSYFLRSPSGCAGQLFVRSSFLEKRSCLSSSLPLSLSPQPAEKGARQPDFPGVLFAVCRPVRSVWPCAHRDHNRASHPLLSICRVAGSLPERKSHPVQPEQRSAFYSVSHPGKKGPSLHAPRFPFAIQQGLMCSIGLRFFWLSLAPSPIFPGVDAARAEISLSLRYPL